MLLETTLWGTLRGNSFKYLSDRDFVEFGKLFLFKKKKEISLPQQDLNTERFCMIDKSSTTLLSRFSKTKNSIKKENVEE